MRSFYCIEYVHVGLVLIIDEIKVQWHTFLTERSFLFCLIEIFVPHKIIFFRFHWYTAYDSNFNRHVCSLRNIFRGHSSFSFLLFFSCPSLSCLCFTEHVYMKRYPTGAHVRNYEKKHERIWQHPRTNQNMWENERVSMDFNWSFFNRSHIEKDEITLCLRIICFNWQTKLITDRCFTN